MPSGAYQKQRTHCPSGHAYDEANTSWKKNEYGVERACKTCQRLRYARKRQKPDIREYQNAAMRKYRAANREHVRALHREGYRKRKEWLDAQKFCCLRCGDRHPATLEFHHRNPAEKDFLLSTAHYKLERLKTEVAKCDVLCSNCHRKHHWEERQRRKANVETLVEV